MKNVSKKREDNIQLRENLFYANDSRKKTAKSMKCTANQLKMF